MGRLRLPPPFPRASTAFVGRQAEVARTLACLPNDALYVVYGVGGIGKTEFVYKVIEEARRLPAWNGVTPILVQVASGETGEQLLSRIMLKLGARTGIIGNPMPDAGRRTEDDLEEIGRVLEEQPVLLFLDDLHLCEPAAAVRLLAYLARHVRASRVFVASRTELAVPPGTPLPVVTRIGPLDAKATHDLAGQLCERLGMAAATAVRARAEQRSGGSPFYVQRELADAARAASTTGAGAADDPLAATLADLDPSARMALLLASLLRGRTSPIDLEALLGPGGPGAVAQLAQRFLVDVDRDVVMVHDLTRDALLSRARPAELAAAHGAAARALASRFNADPRVHVLDGVDAAAHLVAAGDAPAAWKLIQLGYKAIGGAGLDHLLLGPLAQLGKAVPAERLAIEVMRARILVRRSHIALADDVLRAAEGAPGAGRSVRYLLMTGLVAQHLGELARAEACFERALDATDDPAERFRALLSLAVVSAWRGDGERARSLGDDMRRARPNMHVRERARMRWAAMLAHVLDFRFDEAAALGLSTLDELEGDEGAGDLRLMVAMLTTLGQAEAEDLAGARRLYEQLVAPAAQGGTLREQLAALYHGVVLHQEGHLREARTALADTFATLVAHRDHLHACLAGHYLGSTLLALGDTAGALAVLSRTTDAAEATGLASLAPHGRAFEAHTLLAAGRIDDARARAHAAMIGGRTSPFTVLNATAVIAQLDASAGDLEGARRRLDAAGEAAIVHGGTVARAHVALYLAEVELRGGDRASAEACAQQALEHFRTVGRRAMEAHCLTLLALCGRTEARAEALAIATELGLQPLLDRLARLSPGVAPAAPEGRERARRDYDLVVELDAGRIVAAHGERAVKGRPIACALLSRFISARGEVVSAEALYCDVWGGREYHPLKHRNTVYVGVNRLRGALRELLPDREVIETVPSGWRLAEGVRACIFTGDENQEMK